MTQSQVRKVQTPVKKDQCSNSCKGPVAKEIIIPGNDDICLGNILIGTNKYVFQGQIKVERCANCTSMFASIDSVVEAKKMSRMME